MEVKIYHQNGRECGQFFDAVKYWSNALGELHRHGTYSICAKDLPKELHRAYDDLFFEGEFGSLRYLVETAKGYGIALLNEYDDVTAESFSLSMDELFQSVLKDTKSISEDAAFEKADIFVGEYMGINNCHELMVVFPADISKEEFCEAAEKLDTLVHQSAKPLKKNLFRREDPVCRFKGREFE